MPKRPQAESLALGLCVLALATSLPAQTLPVPALPPVEKPPGIEAPATETGTGPAKDATPVAPQPWEYELAVGALYSSNVYYVQPDGSGSTAVLPSADVTRILASSRGELRVSASGSWTGYPAQAVESRFYFGGGLRGDYRLSPGTSVDGEFRYDVGYSDSTPILIEQGVALPLVKTQSLTGELGLTGRLGPRTSVRAGGRVLRATFDAPGFVDGNSFRGSLTLDRNVGARDTLGVMYALERSTGEPVVEPYLTHYGSLQWTHTLSNRSAMLLEGGASYTPDASGVGLERTTGFHGGLTFARKVGRSNVMVFLRREVAPAFGFGVSRLESRAGLNVDVPMGRRWNLRAEAVGTRPDPLKEEQADASHAPSGDVSAAIGRRLGQRVLLTAEGRYRLRGEVASLPSVSDVQAVLRLTFGPPAP